MLFESKKILRKIDGGAVLMQTLLGLAIMIAMTPLITIQVLGLIGKTKQDRMMRKIHLELEQIDDGIVYYDDEEAL